MAKHSLKEGFRVISETEKPLVLSSEAFHGVLGEFVRYVEPTTEADSAAILTQALVGLGIYIGSDFYKLAGDKQRGKLFLVVVGNSSKARKGTAWGIVFDLLSSVDSAFTNKCILNGFGSGEAIIGKLKDSDDSESSQKNDSRLVLAGGEFAQVLQVMNREGNTLSAVIRDGWDNRPMSSIVKHGEIKVSNHHIGIITHITNEELLSLLKGQHYFNGFANRFLYIWSKRSKLLPFPESLDSGRVAEFGYRIRDSIDSLRKKQNFELRFSPSASKIWEQIYNELSRDTYGTTGSILSRAEAQVIRISVIYAVLDGSSWIDDCHLNAALAIWNYSEVSVNRIFGRSILSNEDKLISILKEAKVLRRSDVHAIMGNNSSSAEIERIKNSLIARQEIFIAMNGAGRGRPVEEWIYVQP